MANSLTFAMLQDAVATGSALRCRAVLQPAAGEGSKVFPPTYSGATYAYEQRMVPGSASPVRCVLLDSVQSQANRMEEALQKAIDEDRLGIPYPLVEVDFTGYYPGHDKSEEYQLIDPIGKITSLQAPHRIADAIFRDSQVPEIGKAFLATDSPYGQKLRQASLRNATPLLELCPTALLFGMWDSTGSRGAMGIKIERALVSEIVGVNVVGGVRTSSRIDPLAIQTAAGPIYQAAEGGPRAWTLDESEARKAKKGDPQKFGKSGNPTDINHGNIPPDRDEKHGGVTIEFAEQTIVLSFPALRRLQFPLQSASDDTRKLNTAGRTLIAALGVCAATLAAEDGLDLRSRCLLWPTAPLEWELVGRPGEITSGLTVASDQALALLAEALGEAKAVGLAWLEQPLTLLPSENLVNLVAKSQRFSRDKGGEGAD